MALTLLHQDDFNRANGNLHGATMSDGVGVWSVITGSYSVTSNQGLPSGGSPAVAVDSAMSAVGDQGCSMVTTAADQGVVVRWAAAAAEGTFYLLYRNGNKPEIYKDADGGSFTLLASGGVSDIANGDTIRLNVVGTGLDALVNGVSKATATDSTYATGKCGEYGGYGAGIAFDDWACYTDAATTTRGAPFGARGTAFNGGRTFMGILR